VASDDNEKLPPKVERALAEARRAALRGGTARADESKGGRWLALIPVAIAALLFPLMMPRAAVPRDIPLPAIDGAALSRTIDADRARARAARDKRLPTDVLAVGSALRELNTAQAADSKKLGIDVEVARARAKLDMAFAGAHREGVRDDLLELRALQVEEFLTEVSRFEATGQESKELVAIAGAFIRRVRESGWLEGNHVVLDEVQRRVSYKIVWNAIVGVARDPAFLPTKDEERALYTLYIQHPHPPDSQREGLEVQQREATTDAACRRAEANRTRATELWRAEKIRALGALDGTYPGDYALGVAYFRAGRYESSVDAFEAYVQRHPDGPFALRARNNLKAAIEANGPI
jgi:hypothetical protein